MPNWCSNDLEVTVNLDWYEKNQSKLENSGYDGYYIPAADKVLEVFMNYMKTSCITVPNFKVETNYFDFNQIATQPPGIAKGIINWYPWNNRHWDCKWNSYCSELIDYDWGEEGYLKYEFETPWGPPYSLLEEAVKQFPMLVFTIKCVELGVELDEKVVFKYDGITKYSHIYVEEPYKNIKIDYTNL